MPRGRGARRSTRISRDRRGDQVDDDVGRAREELVLDHLDVVDHGRDRRRLVDDADVGEHAPFEVEEAVALAEADAVERHRRGAGDHEVEAAARSAISASVIGRPKCSSPSSQAAKSSCPLGTIAGLEQAEAAIDAVGRDHHRLAGEQHAPAEVDQAVVRRDEGVARRSRRRARATSRSVASSEPTKSGMTSAKLRWKRESGSATSLQPRPDLLPDDLGARSCPSLPPETIVSDCSMSETMVSYARERVTHKIRGVSLGLLITRRTSDRTTWRRGWRFGSRTGSRR